MSTESRNIVFVHGFLGEASEWRSVTAELAGWNCVTVQLPSLERYTIADLANAVYDQTRELGPSHFVGYSMGGRILLELYHLHPEHFLSLVLESVNPGIESNDERFARIERDRLWAAQLDKDPRGFYRDWYRQPLFGFDKAADEAALDAMMESRLENHSPAYSRMIVQASPGANPSQWGVVERLAAPTLYIAGANDAKYSETAGNVAGKNPKIGAQVLENCGHNVHLADPKRYASVLRDFFERNPA